MLVCAMKALEAFGYESAGVWRFLSGLALVDDSRAHEQALTLEDLALIILLTMRS